MKPQTLFLMLAGVVTGAFLLVAGVVAVWQLAEAQPRVVQPQPRVAMPFRGVGGQVAAIDIAPDLPVEPQQPINLQPVAPAELPKVRGAVVAAKEAKITGPHTHGNLSIFLIHGLDTINDPGILTLQEALEQNVATVRQGGGHQLFIDNRSNMPLFVQSGDIVKGGTQDRVLPEDMLVNARSTGQIIAMCVEAGRSVPRGSESPTSFSSAAEQLPTRSLKLAAHRRSQQDVWNQVQALQTTLAQNIGGSVEAPLSKTSLQLSLEHQRLQDAVQSYFTPLAPILEGTDDVIGYAVVINGKAQSADVYGSSGLFQKLWPRLLRASTVDALAQRQNNETAKPLEAAAVQEFLAVAESGSTTHADVRGRNTRIRQESPATLLLDTCDATQSNAVLHRSYLAK